MAEYRVKWEIDIDAETPTQAAEMALEMQRHPESTATIFEVYHRKSGMFMDSVDLLKTS